MKILIIRVSAIGDVIHTLPAFFYLKNVFPHAHISWVVQEKAAALLQDQPFLEHLFLLPNNFFHPSNWKKTWAIICQLRKIPWDIIIDFQGLLKTSLLLYPLQGKKFGFSKPHAREVISTRFTHHKTTPVYTNIIQKNLALVSDVAQQNTCPSITQLQKDFFLYIPEQKQKIVANWLQLHLDKKFVVLAPNTTWPSKHWPLEHWKQLIDLLVQKNIFVLLLGEFFGQQAKELAHYIKHNNLPAAIAPRWDLLTIAALLKKTALLVAPDTGILHLADFLQVPAIGLFGPTLAKKHGPFLTQQNIRSAIQVSCPHAYQKEHGPYDCMKKLSAAKLCKTILSLLNP